MIKNVDDHKSTETSENIYRKINCYRESVEY